MFKSVEYVGFEDQPELRARAERATAVVAVVIGDWAKHVAIEWEAYPEKPAGAELTLRLILPTAEGTGVRFLPTGELADPSVVEDRCRATWLRALDAYFEKRKPAWDEIITQPAEV